jgi:hypothetical protein
VSLSRTQSDGFFGRDLAGSTVFPAPLALTKRYRLTATTSIVAKRDDLPGQLILPFLSEIECPLSQTGIFLDARPFKAQPLDQGSGTLLIRLR